MRKNGNAYFISGGVLQPNAFSGLNNLKKNYRNKYDPERLFDNLFLQQLFNQTTSNSNNTNNGRCALDNNCLFQTSQQCGLNQQCKITNKNYRLYTDNAALLPK
ncbi:unnamed protein product [Didymodactylos carnosus]|uniref:Uncharacterized protein n=1 Tax=Didymodactylos carnosus TaxID=1234261 RepID=A0A814TWP0_9BILA|nr:unnamed protein product [Didymodactylos carnosus]CAF1523745.1 unnamed protein product [Didymodactylos carnosus]CAF3929275.1 unnamed protein product [Didymodactylos carnosus]CAF4310515.1 unnamed protein product [Didymodactylos carnosus]